MKATREDQFLTLYKPVHDRFERFCRARVFGEMEYRDLMNDTLLIAYQKFDTLQSPDAFLSFLFGVSVRLLANYKKKKRAELIPSEERLLNLTDEGAKTERDTEVYLLHRALALLPEEQREAIILFEISGFSNKEIAAIQSTSLSNVKQRLRRGRIKLTEILTFESAHKTGEVNHGT